MAFGYDPSDQFPPGLLHINLYYGRNLRIRESSRVDQFGRADPYVVINYDGKEIKSKVCLDQDASPEWNQHFTFPIRRQGDTPTSEGRSEASRGFRKLFSSRPTEKSILEPDTLEFTIYDKNNFRQDFDMGKVRIPNVPSVITSQRDWYLEKQAFAVYDKSRSGETVYAGELWMEIGFEKVDEFDFAMGWITDPTVDDRIHAFFSLPREPEIVLPDEDDKLKIRDLTAEVSKLSGIVASLKAQLEQARKAYQNLQNQSREEVAQAKADAEESKLALEASKEEVVESQGLLATVKSELEAMKSELNVSKKDAAQLEIKLKTVVDQTTHLDTQNNYLQGTLLSLEEEARNLREDLQASADKYQIADRDLLLEKENHSSLQISHSALEGMRDSIAQELAQSQKLVEELQEEKRSVEEENALFGQKISDLEARLQTAVDQTVDLESQKENLKTNLSRLEEEVGGLREELQVARVKHSETDRDLQFERESHSGLQASHADLQGKKNEIEQELQLVRKLVDELEAHKAAVLEHNSSLGDKVGDLESKLEISLKQTEDLQKQTEDLQTVIKELKETVTRSEEEAGGLREGLQIAEDKYQNTDRDLQVERENHSGLQTAHAALQERKDVIEQELSQSRQLLDELQSHKTSMLETNSTLADKVAELEAKLESTMKQTTDLETVNKEIQGTITKFEEEARGLREGLQVVEDKYQNTDRDLKFERENHSGLQVTHAALQEKKDGIEQELLQAQTLLDELQTHKASVLEQNAALGEKVAELEAKLETAVQEGTQLQETVSRIEEESRGLRENLQVAEDKFTNTDRDFQSERESFSGLQTTHAALQGRKDELEQELIQAQKLLDELHSHKASVLEQNASLGEKVAELEAKLEIAVLEGNQLHETVSRVEEESRGLREDLQLAEEKFSNMDRDLQFERENHSGLQSTHAVLQGKKDEIEQELLHAQNLVNELQSHKASALEQNSFLGDKVAQLQAELENAVKQSADLETVNKELQEALTRFEAEAGDLKQNLQSAQDKCQNTDRDFQLERENHVGLQASHAALQGERDEIKGELERFQKLLDELQAHNDSVQELNKILGDKVAKLETQLQTALSETADLQTTNKKLQATITKFEVDTDGLKEDLRVAVDRHETADRDWQSEKERHLSLQATHEALQQEREEIENELSQLRKLVEELQSLKGSVTEENTSLGGKVAELEAKLEHAGNQTGDLDSQNKSLQAIISNLEAEVSGLREGLQSAQDKHQTTDRDFQLEKENHSNLQAKHAALQDERDQFEADLFQSKELLKELEELKAKMMEETASLSAKSDDLESRLQTANDQTTDRDNHLTELQAIVTKLELEGAGLREDLQAALDKYQSLEGDHSGLLVDYTSLQETKGQVEQELSHSRKQLEELETHTSTILEEKSALSAQVADLEAKLQSLVDQTAEVDNRNRELEEIVRKSEVDATSLREELQGALAKHETTDRDFQLERENRSSLQSQHASLEKERDKLQADLSQYQKLLEELEALKTSMIEENAALVTELETKLQVANDQTIDRDNQLKEFQATVTGLESEGAGLREALKVALEKHQSMEGDHSGLLLSFASLQERRDQIDQELSASRKLLEELETHKSSMLEENSWLTAKVADLEAKLQSSVNRTDELDGLNSELQEILKKSELETTSLKDELQSALDKHQSTDRDFQLEKEKHTNLRDQHAALQDKKDQIERELLAKLDQQNVDLSGQIDNLGGKFKSLNAGLTWQKYTKAASLETKIASVENELEVVSASAHKTTQSLQKEMETSSSLRREVSELTGKRDKLEKELEAANSRIKELQDSVNTIQAQVAGLNDQKDKLSHAKAQTEAELGKARELGAELQGSLKSTQNQLLELGDAKSATEVELHSVQARVAELQKNFKSMQVQYADLTAEKMKSEKAQATIQEELKQVTSNSSATVKQLKDQLFAAQDRERVLTENLEEAKLTALKLTTSGNSMWESLCCCLGASRHPLDKRDERTPLLGSSTQATPVPAKKVESLQAPSSSGQGLSKRK